MSRPHLSRCTSISPRHRALYLSVGLVAGAVIALQICIMRIFAVGSWAHFGSLVVSLAMLGFGLTSVVMCVGKDWFERHWHGVAAASLLLFGPLTVAANLLAQQIPFNAIFLVSDPTQKWRLLANFLLYLLPFLAGAFFLGTVFLKAQQDLRPRLFRRSHRRRARRPRRSSAAMYLFAAGEPHRRAAAAVVRRQRCCGSRRSADRRGSVWLLGRGGARRSPPTSRCPPLLGIPKLAVSDYKGVAYARKFPDASASTRSVSPFGDLEVYSSSYLHFAPGLSDNAAFNLPKMPANAYLGMYIDGDGPNGIMRDLPPSETAYFRYLPMYYPYVIKHDARHLRRAVRRRHLDLGGAASNSKSVTVAEGNPAVLARLPRPTRACAISPATSSTIRRCSVIDYDGRLYLANTDEALRRHRPEPRRLGRPVQSRRLRHRREVSPTRARRCRATCARSTTAACSR